MCGTLALGAQIDQREEMLVDRVDAAGADEPHEVDRAARLLGVIARGDKHAVVEERPVANRFADAHEVLHDDAAGAEVQMADLAVAHLPLGEPDREARRLEQRPRVARDERVPRRRVRRARWRCRHARGDSPSRRARRAPRADVWTRSREGRLEGRRRIIGEIYTRRRAGRTEAPRDLSARPLRSGFPIRHPTLIMASMAAPLAPRVPSVRSSLHASLSPPHARTSVSGDRCRRLTIGAAQARARASRERGAMMRTLGGVIRGGRTTWMTVVIAGVAALGVIQFHRPLGRRRSRSRASISPPARR